MILGKHCQLPVLAGKSPDRTKRESAVKKFSRWLQNRDIIGNIYFLPFIEKLLLILSQQTLYLILDGSIIGRNSACLMVSVVYKHRAIPVAWLVIEGKKGHFCEAYHIEVLQLAKTLLPENVNVVVLGDGEFDGVNFLKTIEDFGWYFAVRTSKNAHLQCNKQAIKLPATLLEDKSVYWLNVIFTKALFGPLTLVMWRPLKEKRALYLVSNGKIPSQIIAWYKHRHKIETLFSDKKSRGFQLHKSHLSDIARLGRLLIASCIAYIWLILLGEQALITGVNKYFHRTERCDLSLLQLGFRLIDYLLNNAVPVPKLEINFNFINRVQKCVR